MDFKGRWENQDFILKSIWEQSALNLSCTCLVVDCLSVCVCLYQNGNNDIVLYWMLYKSLSLRQHVTLARYHGSSALFSRYLEKENCILGNSSEIKLTIDFHSNFVYWIFIIWELQFRNKKGLPMLIKEHWGIENAPF